MERIVFTLILAAVLLPNEGNAVQGRTLRLDEKTVGRVFVTPGRTTVLTFTARPTKAVLGSRGAFALEYVEKDIAVAALSPRASSNLFVYLEGRRFAFDLVTAGSGGDELVFVRDQLETPVKVKMK